MTRYGTDQCSHLTSCGSCLHWCRNWPCPNPHDGLEKRRWTPVEASCVWDCACPGSQICSRQCSQTARWQERRWIKTKMLPSICEINDFLQNPTFNIYLYMCVCYVSPFQQYQSWHPLEWSTYDVLSPPASPAPHPRPLSPASPGSSFPRDPVPGNHPPLRWVIFIKHFTFQTFSLFTFHTLKFTYILTYRIRIVFMHQKW